MTDSALSAKALAIELKTNARTIRKFFRSDASPIEPVGQGNRYEVEPEDLAKVRKAFKKWSTPKPVEKPPSLVQDEATDEVEDFTDLDPEDDDLYQFEED